MLTSTEEERESFLWENKTWGLSNSDKSGGSTEDSFLGKRLQGSSSNSQTETGNKGIGSKKRGQNNQEPACKNNGRGSSSTTASESKERKGGGGGGGGSGGGGGGGDGGGESDHDIHIWTERERRKKMRNMFSNLHALLPQLPPKADKSTIVDEAVSYIKTLQQTLQSLQKQKLERLQGASATFRYTPSLIGPQKLPNSREAFLADQASNNGNYSAITATQSSLSVASHPILFQTWTSSNVVLNICCNEAQISICSPKRPGLLTAICYVLEKHNIDVLSAHFSSDCNRSMYMIQAQARGASDDQYTVAFPVEEIFQQAAGEIMSLISS